MPCGRMGSGLASLWAIAGERKQNFIDSAESDKVLVHCPECHWQITGNFASCPKCGTRLKPFRCEYCDSIFPRDLSECPHCGAPAA